LARIGDQGLPIGISELWQQGIGVELRIDLYGKIDILKVDNL
jgi:hypothetical protein